MGERKTDDLLKEWGKWNRQGGGVDLSMRSVLANLIPVKRSGFIAANICDSDALIVDRAVAQLTKSRPLIGRVLWLQYVCGYSNSKIATVIGCTREQASNLSGRAWGLVDSALNPSDVFTQADLEDLVTLLNAA
jgi:hypothetical protein